MPLYKKVIRAGEIMEVEIYQSLRTIGQHIPRERRKAASTEAQAKLNEINRKKNLRRKLNANFGPGDLFLTFTYTQIPQTEQALRDLSNFIRRVNYARKKRGRDNVRFVAVTEQQGTRLHHHIIISGITANEAFAQWQKTRGAGHIYRAVPLYEHDRDYSQLADYLLKETRNRTGKRWTESRNLVQPIIEYKTISKQDRKTLQGGPIRIPKDYMLVDEERQGNDLTGIMCYFKYKKKNPTVNAEKRSDLTQTNGVKDRYSMP